MYGEDGTVGRSQHVAEHERGDDRIVERSQERDELGDQIDGETSHADGEPEPGLVPLGAPRGS